MSVAEQLKVTTHVGRDLLAAAAGFKSEAATVWEYVINSLQYVDEGVLPKVQVIVKPRLKIIEIIDNGSGMTADGPDGLAHYFTMHGENPERLRGRPGRGKFGTGKSAAFGIGNILRVDTCRGGIRNIVELTRTAIENSGGKEIDLDWIIRDEPTASANGTLVTINEIFLRDIRTSPIVEYIERHLQIFRARMPEVAVNEHVCQYREPNIAAVYTFQPSTAQAEVTGSTELTINVASSPLPRGEQGVAVTAGRGNFVALETAGIEGKELGNYLFGSIDVPLLESADSPIEPYDSTRSLQLNPLHPVVRVLLPFIGSKLEQVRKEQMQQLRAAKKTEEARRLASEAQRIAEILNDDFKTVIGRLNDIRSASARPGNVSSHFGNASEGDTQEGVWVEGIETPGDIEKPDSPDKPDQPDRPDPPPVPKPPKPDPNIIHTGHENEQGEAAVDPAGGSGKKKHRPRGGFSVDFRSLGDESDRSKYDRTTLTILINLDHAVVKNALRNASVEDINFRRLAYEIAFTEYSIALGVEMVEQDPDMPADDILYEVRSTLNRVSSSAASLYG